MVQEQCFYYAQSREEIKREIAQQFCDELKDRLRRLEVSHEIPIDWTLQWTNGTSIQLSTACLEGLKRSFIEFKNCNNHQ